MDSVQDKIQKKIDRMEENIVFGKPGFNYAAKPTHYQTVTGFDVIDFAKAYNLNFNRGNVAKYISRAGKKEDELKDLKKALDYLQREIKYLEDGSGI